MKINPDRLRKHVLDLAREKQSCHVGGSLSLADIVAYLYSTYDFKHKDKLVLSKGHSVPILYATFYELGWITQKEFFNTFREINSRLQGHPHKLALEYIHASTGSLGQGLSIALGHALGLKLKNETGKVFCIVGDGELQEGQCWEAIMLAPKYKLNNLICVLDDNKGQGEGTTFPQVDNLYDIVTNFGWKTYFIDGHKQDEINYSLGINSHLTNKPTFVIAHTVKGKGISHIVDANWHAKIPSEMEYNLAIKDLRL